MADIDPRIEADVRDKAARAREAGRVLASLPRARKDAVLLTLADALDGAAATVLPANEVDLAAGRESGIADSLLDRLRLDEARLAGIAAAVRQVAALPDPVGEVVRGSTLPNGLQITQVRVPRRPCYSVQRSRNGGDETADSSLSWCGAGSRRASATRRP